MLLGGDEFRRSQQGNNNPYCQDNETSWYDWNNLKQHEDIYRFARRMIAFRKAHPTLSREQFYTDFEISWFNAHGDTVDWNDPGLKAFACEIRETEHSRLFLMFNACWEATDFVLPSAPGMDTWQLAVDTSREESEEPSESQRVNSKIYSAAMHSSAILLSQ